MFVLLSALATAFASSAAAGPIPDEIPPEWYTCSWHSTLQNAAPDLVGFRDGAPCYVVLFPCDDHSRYSCAPEREPLPEI